METDEVTTESPAEDTASEDELGGYSGSIHVDIVEPMLARNLAKGRL